MLKLYGRWHGLNYEFLSDQLLIYHRSSILYKSYTMLDGVPWTATRYMPDELILLQSKYER